MLLTSLGKSGPPLVFWYYYCFLPVISATEMDSKIPEISGAACWNSCWKELLRVFFLWLNKIPIRGLHYPTHLLNRAWTKSHLPLLRCQHVLPEYLLGPPKCHFHSLSKLRTAWTFASETAFATAFWLSYISQVNQESTLWTLLGKTTSLNTCVS